LAYSFYMDSSALAKRYVPETGSGLVDEILDNVAGRRIYLLNVGAGEVISILVRRKNAGGISAADLTDLLVDFYSEIVHRRPVRKMPITNRLAINAFSLIVTHSINSTDAIALKSALAIADKLRARGDDLVLVASDQRLLRAAQAEGLATFNPENQDQAALAAFIRP
jgi:predicted nucleic acid-binding protein